MKNNKIKAVAVLALAGTILTQPIATMAASYSDVRTGSWAEPHITKLTNLKVISGYNDGTFKPKRSVSYLEIMQLLKGIQNPSAQDVTAAISRYGHVSDTYKVPGWARSAICVALDNGVITEENLKAAYKKGFITSQPKENQFPSRELVMVYYAKALGIEAKKDISNIKVKDLNAIGKTPKALIGDVDVKGLYAGIIDAGVFHTTGDDGYFNPQQPLHRDQMATITNLSYDYRNAAKQTTDYEGEVYFNEEVNGTPSFAIKGKDDKAIAFVLGSDTKITLNGKPGTAKDITIGSKVKVSAYASNTGVASLHALKVDIVSNDIVGTGVVRSTEKDGMTVDYVTKKDAKVDSKFKADYTTKFKFDKDTKVKSLGKEIKAEDIRATDMVIFKAKNGVLSEVEVYPQSGVASGELVDFYYGSSFANDAKLYLKLADGKTYTFNAEDSRISKELSELTRNLKKGYPLTIKTSYGNVVAVSETEESISGLFDNMAIYTFGERKISIKTNSGVRQYTVKDELNFREHPDSKAVKMSAGQVSDYITNLKGYKQIEVELQLKGGQVEGITLARQLMNRDEKVEIKSLAKIVDKVPGSNWAINTVEGYSAYEVTYKGDLKKYGEVELPQYFQIKKDYDRALSFAGNQDNMEIKFDVYRLGNDYSIGNVRINGKYELNDVPIYFYK